MDLITLIETIGQYVCSSLGIRPPDMRDDLVAEFAAEVDVYMNAGAVMVDASQPIGMES